MYSMQRQQLSMQLEEMKMAQEALKEAPGKVYRAIGNLLIETTAAAAKKDLSEKIETYEVRAASMAKQEEKARAKAEELRIDLEKMVGSAEGRPPSGA